MSDAILSLGRYGDLIGLLPWCWKRRNDPVKFVVGHEFASLFDGVSYVQPMRYSKGCIDLPDAIKVTRATLPNVKVAQTFMNPDKRRMTDSYAKESYRIIGALNEFGTQPLVFDRRDAKREKELVKKHRDGRPLILLAVSGISSPFKHGSELKKLVGEMFLTHQVLDMNVVRAERIYDLLGLMDCATLMFTIDTVHLWLAAASKCPVVTFSNDGWLGSPPPRTSVLSQRYSHANIPHVVEEAVALMEPAGRSILVADAYGDTDRHKRAQATWKPDVLIQRAEWGNRDARSIGDPAPVPFLKDLLTEAFRVADEKDIIIWTNSDTGFSRGALRKIKDHCKVFGACSVRRDPAHIGRELFAFSRPWLRDHLHSMPDCILTYPWFDMTLAAYIRKSKGIRSTMENFIEDFFPAELPAGLVTHEDHPSGWLGREQNPAAKWNEQQLKEML